MDDKFDLVIETKFLNIDKIDLSEYYFNSS